MRRHLRHLSLVAALGMLAAAFGAGPGLLPVAEASSHREAPLIALDPYADNTDVYAFVSPDRANSVTVIANYIPLEEPSGGPNFYRFDDNVLYQIRFDNNGDARLTSSSNSASAPWSATATRSSTTRTRLTTCPTRTGASSSSWT